MKEEINEEHVLNIVENINVAAIENNSMGHCWVSQFIHVQNKIRNEISDILKGRPVTESNLHELTYLQATVNETLRLPTPIPLQVHPIQTLKKLQ